MARVEPGKVDSLVVPPRRSGTWRTVTVALCVVVLAVLLAWRMVPHPVGPARTVGKYRGKAVSTAKAADSEVQTVLLVVQAGASGNVFGGYAGLVVSDAEESLNGVQGTFDSIQPPDSASDAVRSQLDEILGSALDHVTRTRIAVRRGQLSQLVDVSRLLAQDSQKLNAFNERYQ